MKTPAKISRGITSASMAKIANHVRAVSSRPGSAPITSDYEYVLTLQNLAFLRGSCSGERQLAEYRRQKARCRRYERMILEGGQA